MTTLTKLLLAVLACRSSATNYYVDCSQSATGSGTHSSPWNSLCQVNKQTFDAGDYLLFKAGTTCDGILQPHGSGSEGTPITISRYGSAAKDNPVINGTGVVGAAVNLTNIDYWTVTNLSVTNPAATLAARQGINVQATDGQAHRGIVVEGNAVFAVAGQTSKNSPHAQDFVDSGGIVFGATDGDGGHLNDVLVRNNTVTDCGGGGIKVRVGSLGSRGNNTRVTQNRVDQCGGDGVIVSYSNSPLIDYNVASYLGTGLYPYSGGNFAGIWVLGDYNPVIRHNVVYGTIMSAVDSEAFDCDWGNEGVCTVEYNYSHDNAGGAYLNCDGCGTSGGATQVVRYNIFQNDCRIYSSGNAVSLEFYQNVMYCPDKAFEIAVPTNTKFTNNIFVGNSNSTLPTGPGISWLWNVFQDVDEPTANGIVVGNAGFVDAGSGGDTLDSAAGYRLKTTSPALHNGGVIAGNGGKDFYGSAVSSTSKPNRGVYEGDGVALC